jgi:hypothetical protein
MDDKRRREEHGRAVLGFDQVLRTPAMLAAAQAEQATDTSPVADQHRAAARHVYERMQRLYESGHPAAERFAELIPGDVPGWLRLGLIDAWLGFYDGTASTCLHNPDPHQATAVAAAAWRPGVIVCGRRECYDRLLGFPHGSIRDRTCDACGHVCAGTDDDMVHTGMLAAGAFVFIFGTCAGCRVGVETEGR